ncbi:MAG: hypothetical protein HND46_24300, partial [Chloroflexi bacterium]|nr:hypothetical protein [Chloroflexota bacterium]NOG66539.1 hypothetical protein [Chloroflexota bacterium]
MSLKRLVTLIYFILVVAHLAAPLASAQEADKEVLVVDLTGPVTPIMLGLIERSIVEADSRNAEA